MSDGIVWEDPAPSRRGPVRWRSRWADALDALRERPGQWARIGVMDPPQRRAADTARRINLGRVPEARPAGAFEATSRMLDDGLRYAVYARYVGAPDETIPDPSAAVGAGADGGGGDRHVPGRSATGARDDASGGSRRPGQPTKTGEAS